MTAAISNWASWITSLWNMCASNAILSIPLITIIVTIVLWMFDKFKGLIK